MLYLFIHLFMSYPFGFHVILIWIITWYIENKLLEQKKYSRMPLVHEKDQVNVHCFVLMEN